MSQVFVDLDGVLADFDAHHETHFGFRPDKTVNNVDWTAVRGIKDFYLTMPLLPDALELWEYVRGLNTPPVILTGIPRSVEEAAANKRGWVAKHLGDHVQVICCPSKDKSLYAAPGDILIDDWEKYRHLWMAKGGRWITHLSARNSIEELYEMGVGL